MKHTIFFPDGLQAEKPFLFDIHRLYQKFSKLVDRRHPRGVRYPLALMLTIAVLAKLTGENTINAIAEWARLRADELTDLFHCQRKTMPHPTTWYRNLANAVDPQELTQAVREVLAPPDPEVPERGSILLVLDGKTLRGTIPPGQTRGVHLLAAYLPERGVVLAQVEVEHKENEIVAAPRLLRQLDLTGMVVTGDAMHTQREISRQIVEQGGDYLWTVKNNQPLLREQVEMLFDPELVEFIGGEAETDFRHDKTIDKGHGRLEERRITVSSLLRETVDWPYLEQAFQLETRITDMKTGVVTTEIRYGITSQPSRLASPKKLLEQVRGEWGIETGLHGRRDVTLREDHDHARQGNGPHVMAVLNNTIVGLVLKRGFTNLAHARRTLNYQVNRCLLQRMHSLVTSYK